ncbi:hypothetical protein [Methanolobus halotolerans]|uniref:Uncharacterized protein n=1 Tax=Methanolobus halotolerans TaxID=2052935 RepID=A0A4E0PUU5_9EURY|nr:hypothetical protein [Methanolobus halotolerans]TGC07303.1 hypothetical protein CUN85_11660 [Methanolobus halotolerans]
MKKWNDSAQMILIAGFAIGIGIVVLTVMLNNIIYASNTASEANIETNVFDFSSTMKVTTHAYEKAYEANSIDNAYIFNYTRKMAESYALAGFIFTLSNDSLQEPYLSQNGLNNGNSDWVVIDRVNRTDIFEIGINTSRLGNESKPFVIEALNQSGMFWSARICNSSGTFNLTVTNSTDILRTENIGGGSPSLNITNNTPFDFHFDTLTSGEQYRIRFTNGSQAGGTFSISGELTNGQPFEIKRYHVLSTTMSLNKNGHMEMNVTIPVTLPGGQI